MVWWHWLLAVALVLLVLLPAWDVPNGDHGKGERS
jgi:hypothetical protein